MLRSPPSAKRFMRSVRSLLARVDMRAAKLLAAAACSGVDFAAAVLRNDWARSASLAPYRSAPASEPTRRLRRSPSESGSMGRNGRRLPVVEAMLKLAPRQGADAASTIVSRCPRSRSSSEASRPDRPAPTTRMCIWTGKNENAHSTKITRQLARQAASVLSAASHFRSEKTAKAGKQRWLRRNRLKCSD